MIFLNKLNRIFALGVLGSFICFSACATNPEDKQAKTSSADAQLDPQDWLKRLDWKSDCGDEAFYEEGHLPPTTVYNVGGKQLINVTCSRGTYQAIQLLYIVDSRSTERGHCLSAPQIKASESNAKSPFERFGDCLMNGSMTVDEAQKSVTLFQRYRGVGGCGHLIKYKLVGDALVPAEIHGQPVCSADITPLEMWPSYALSDFEHWPKVESPWR